MNGVPTAMSHPDTIRGRQNDDFALPVTRYALSGDVSIAFQVMGDGPVDLVLVPGVVCTSIFQSCPDIRHFCAAFRRSPA